MATTTSTHPELAELLAQRAANEPAPAARPPSTRPRAVWLPLVSILVGLALVAGGMDLVGRMITGSANPVDWPRDGRTRTAWSAKDLETLIVDHSPAGYVPGQDIVDGQTTIDRASALENEDVPDAKPLLEDGFVRGHVRAWKKSKTDFVAVVVYQFENHRLAADYVDANVRHPDLGGTPLTAAPAPDVPDVHAFAWTSPDSAAGIEALMWSRGPYAIVAVGVAADHDMTEAVVAVAKDQHHRLSKWPWLDEKLA